MKKIISQFNMCLRILFGYIGILMILIQSYAVFARNVLKLPSPWTDETLKLMFVWLIFVCAALAFFDEDLIGLDLLEEMLQRRGNYKWLLKLVQNICALVYGIFTFKWSIDIVSVQISTMESTAVVKYPLWIINLGFLAGSFMVIIFAAYKIIRGFKKS